MTLATADQEDARVLPLVDALKALPGLHPTRWCGGHTKTTLDNIPAASSTRLEGMDHPPSENPEYWVEIMVDPHDTHALMSIYKLVLAFDDDYGTHAQVMLSAPWEGLTVTIIGDHNTRSPEALAAEITQIDNEPDDPNLSDHIARRITDYGHGNNLT